MRRTHIFLAGILALCLAPLGGCRDEVRDCRQVCDAYDDCFAEPGFDQDFCEDRCEEAADADEFFDDRLETCASCVDDASCSQLDACDVECDGVVVGS